MFFKSEFFHFKNDVYSLFSNFRLKCKMTTWYKPTTIDCCQNNVIEVLRYTIQNSRIWNKSNHVKAVLTLHYQLQVLFSKFVQIWNHMFKIVIFRGDFFLGIFTVQIIKPNPSLYLFLASKIEKYLKERCYISPSWIPCAR